MTVAELHGKLSTSNPARLHDRLEDLLTSDVFGTMKYVGWQFGFLDWIYSAEAATPGQPQNLSSLIPAQGLQQIRFCFWPTLPNGREPDLALLFEYSESTSLVVVEAKLYSGTSD